MSFKVTLALYLLHKQVHAVRDVTFTEVTGTFTAKMLYQKTIESEVECLNICYDQKTCKFVHHFEDNCTLYKRGTIPYLSREVTYELDRSLRSSFCTFEIPLPQTVNIVPIKKQPDEEVMCNGLPFRLTTIHMYITETKLTLYSDSHLVGNFTEAQRLFFAKIPQEHCVAVPVFTGPSECKSRLYFGEVYNTSGYDFLDAYAFTGKCACVLSNACCGNIGIDEYWVAHTDPDRAYGYFYDGTTTSIHTYGSKGNDQQFYIAGEEWLVSLT